MSHKYAKQMLEYAKDAQETDKPWERWQFFSRTCNNWVNCTNPIDWDDRPLIDNYRKKPGIDNVLKFDMIINEIKKNFNIIDVNCSVEIRDFIRSDVKSRSLCNIFLVVDQK